MSQNVLSTKTTLKIMVFYDVMAFFYTVAEYCVHLKAVTIYCHTVILTTYWPHLSNVYKHLTSQLNNLKY